MTPSEKILALLLATDKLTTRQITDRMIADGYQWPGQPVTFDRVHHKLISMLLQGQVRRKKSEGVWIWRLP